MGTLAAVVLAAGLSSRMGRPKMALPWGETTVIGQVTMTLAAAGLDEVVVVTGGARQTVEAALCAVKLPCPLRWVFNPRYAEDSMMLSLQTGLAALGQGVEAACVALGDQPQMQADVVRALSEAWRTSASPLVVPSYHMRRGHPWLLARSLWAETLSAPAALTLRNFLDAHAGQIHYLPVETPTVLADLDTPQDYASACP